MHEIQLSNVKKFFFCHTSQKKLHLCYRDQLVSVAEGSDQCLL